MPINSRAKGTRAEREVELAFQARGFSTDRNIGGRHQAAGDIAVEGLAVEVRRRDTQTPVTTWCEDHEAAAPAHLTPIVVWRKSRGQWRVALPLEDFLDLLSEARA